MTTAAQYCGWVLGVARVRKRTSESFPRAKALRFELEHKGTTLQSVGTIALQRVTWFATVYSIWCTASGSFIKPEGP